MGLYDAFDFSRIMCDILCVLLVTKNTLSLRTIMSVHIYIFTCESIEHFLALADTRQNL